MAVVPRLRILVGCEGQSEAGYAAGLALLARDLGLAIHIQPQVMTGGDTLKRLVWFEHWINAEEDRRGRFDHKFALLDTDLDQQNAERADQARRIAHRAGVNVVWQAPVHEAVLVRHFDGHTTRRPPDARSAMEALLRLWQGYRKGLPGILYRRVLTDAHLLRAASVERDLSALLQATRVLHGRD
jgi:hypothetical protein